LLTAVTDAAEEENAQAYLAQLMELGRMPKGTTPLVYVGDFETCLKQAPQADLNIFGLQTHVNLPFMRRMMTNTHASCIFVRDSGMESALV
ncbi:MAG: hypothetical protein KC445_12715, partial [Anaerolineales bacterium]|nr:hypothetical protein [Anaerolineales bacterium]